MTNDIRKHIMLIESIILDKSFKDAQAKFSTTASSEEVKSYIEKFKELSKRNIIKGQDKDIGFWIKGDWVDFKQFVDSNSTVVTKRQSKATQKKDSIVVYKDDTKQVVIPLTKEASILYGKNTRWCTAATESKNYFINYFYLNKITLFYVLLNDGTKYACAFHPENPDTMECFDQADDSMTVGKFEKATGITKKDAQDWYNSNKSQIENGRDLNKVGEEVQLAIVQEKGDTIRHIDNPSEELQLAAVQQDVYAIRYIDNPSEELQLAAVQQKGYAIRFIDNPSEAVQLAAVQQDVYAIEFIDNPSEGLKLAAVKQNGNTIKYIKNPSEEVQIAAVNQDGNIIRHIANPSEAAQLVVVQRNGLAIRFIDNPSEAVQLAAVNQDGRAIRFIDNPSEEVQLATVKQNGNTIKYIKNPSEEVQLAAVTKTKFAIGYIDNPSEKVKALYKKLWEQ